MKKLIITASIFIATSVLMVSCGQRSSDKANDSATEEAITAMYHCPMHCEGDKTYEVAGACPVCGMDLVTEHEHHH